MQVNNLKTRLKNGETVLGTWCGMPSPSACNAIAVSGLDFAVIDSEHGPITMETAEDMVRAFDSENMNSVIRVSANVPHLILRALDTGCGGVQIPHISTKEDAVFAVKSSKYAPIGERGYTPFTRAGKYGTLAKDYAKVSNDKTLVVINVEGKEGIRNLRTIAEVDNIDVIFVGPYDLSQSFGVPGDVENKSVLDAIKEAVEISKSNGKSVGSYARDMKYAEILIDLGVQYITYTVDSTCLTNAYNDIYNQLKKRIGK